MDDIQMVAIVTVLALITYFGQLILVGRARGKYDVKAPATTGNEIFERYFRVQMNTLEQLIIFLPSLWLFALFINGMAASTLGLIWILGRILYAQRYYADPTTRGPGAMITGLSSIVLMFGALVGAIADWL